MKEIMMDGRKITITPSAEATDIVVYCNNYGDGTKEILDACRQLHCHPFHLVVVSKIHWDADLSPWPAGKIISKQDGFKGQAQQYLSWMQETLLPACENELKLASPTRILAGYSMAGLFALFALYHTHLFRAFVSASGSLWFPDFKDYALSHPVLGSPIVYISIGDKESNSKNSYLQTTIQYSNMIASHYSESGLLCRFELNPGNHFTQMQQRLAKGILWVTDKGLHPSEGDHVDGSINGVNTPLHNKVSSEQN